VESAALQREEIAREWRFAASWREEKLESGECSIMKGRGG
jgi:hypothetical protein